MILPPKDKSLVCCHKISDGREVARGTGGYEREKRGYAKRKTLFWEEGGKQEAAKKVVRISTTPVMDGNEQITSLQSWIILKK